MKPLSSQELNSLRHESDCSVRNAWRRLMILAILLILGPRPAAANSEGLTSPSIGPAAIFNPGDLIFTDSAAALLRYNTKTGDTSLLLSGGLLVRPFGIAVGDDQTIYVTDTGSAGVIAINPRTGKPRLLAHGQPLGIPYGIAVSQENEIYVANGQSVLAIDPICGTQRMIFQRGLLRAPLGLAIGSGGELFVADAGGSVISIQPRTGAQKLVTTGLYLGSPAGIAVAGSDRLYVADSTTRRIVCIRAKTGEQTLVAADGDLATPVGLAFSGKSDLLVVDPDAFDLAGGIIRVDLHEGSQSRVLSGAGDFVNPRCVAVIHRKLRIP